MIALARVIISIIDSIMGYRPILRVYQGILLILLMDHGPIFKGLSRIY